MIKYDFYRNSLKVRGKNNVWWDYVRQGITEEEVKTVVRELGTKDAIKKLTDEGKIKPIYGGEIEYE